MKKYYLLLVTVFFIFSCNNEINNESDQDSTKNEETVIENSEKDDSSEIKFKTYGIESGLIEYSMEMMGIATKTTTYFKKNGKIQCVDASIELLGKVMTTRTLITKDYVYLLNVENKTGTKTKITNKKEEFDVNNIDFENISDEIIKKYNLKEEGYEKIAGKKCKIFSVDEGGKIGKYWIWENIALKWEAEENNMKIAMTATKVEENPSFPDNIFEIPEDFKINEINIDDIKN